MNVVNIRSVPSLQSGIRVLPRQSRSVTSHVSAVSAPTREFGPFRLDTANQCLWLRNDNGDEERILLKPKAFAILRYLVTNAGRLLTQDELLDAVWPDTHIQPDVLKRHIFEIRDVLGDNPKTPTYIETLPRRGYQFMAAVRDIALAEDIATDASPRAELLGRERALGELRGYLSKALGGQRQVVFVTGEPGIGKTALVDEFQRQAASRAPILIARGQCVEGYGGKEAYYSMLEALGSLCRGPGGGSVVQVLASHAPTWLVQFPALVTPEQREALQRELLGATRERMLREVVGALETIATTTPLLLVLEDLQWVDPSTVDLISAIARGRAPAKLMLIGTYRPMEVSPFEYPLMRVKHDLLIHQLCREIALHPIGEADVARYIGGELPGEDQPAGLAALVHRHSGGNPLFMAAVLEHMSDRGFLANEDGRWTLKVPFEKIDVAVREHLREMIESQIERLSPVQQRASEAASVSGLQFDSRVRAKAATSNEAGFQDICESQAHCRHIVNEAGSYEVPEGTIAHQDESSQPWYREVFKRRQMSLREGETAPVLRLAVGGSFS